MASRYARSVPPLWKVSGTSNGRAFASPSTVGVSPQPSLPRTFATAVVAAVDEGFEDVVVADEDSLDDEQPTSAAAARNVEATSPKRRLRRSWGRSAVTWAPCR